MAQFINYDFCHPGSVLNGRLLSSTAKCLWHSNSDYKVSPLTHPKEKGGKRLRQNNSSFLNIRFSTIYKLLEKILLHDKHHTEYLPCSELHFLVNKWSKHLATKFKPPVPTSSGVERMLQLRSVVFSVCRGDLCTWGQTLHLAKLQKLFVSSFSVCQDVLVLSSLEQINQIK